MIYIHILFADVKIYFNTCIYKLNLHISQKLLLLIFK
jgi:hypothetical protein